MKTFPMTFLASVLTPCLAAAFPAAELDPTFTSPGGASGTNLFVKVGGGVDPKAAHAVYFPTGRPQRVMPFGAGDNSGMVSFGSDNCELHLSKTDFLAFTTDGLDKEFCSPGHLTLRFPGLDARPFRSFVQRMRLGDGVVAVGIVLDDGGELRIEASGDMAANVLRVRVRDGRRVRSPVEVRYRNWRLDVDDVSYYPWNWVAKGVAKNRYLTIGEVIGAALRCEGRDVLFTQRINCDGSANVPGKAKKVDPFAAVGRNYAVRMGFRETVGAVPRLDGRTDAVWTVPADAPSDWTLFVACESSRGDAAAAAKAKLSGVRAKTDAALDAARTEWWRAFWDRSCVELEGGDEAAYVSRMWAVNVASYAAVGYGPVPPNFGGGAGLVFRDARPWGRNVWYQNTREMIWPWGAAGHAEFARAHLDFYDGCIETFREQSARGEQKHVGGVNMPETVEVLGYRPFSTNAAVTHPAVDAPYAEPTLEQREAALKIRLARKPAPRNHVYSSGTELLVETFDCLRYTGDESLLPLVARWLRDQTELYVGLLFEGEDGFWHVRCTNANESWHKVDDSAPDLCAARFCFEATVRHGKRFGYPETLVAAAKRRLEKLAPMPLAERLVLKNEALWKNDLARSGAIAELVPGDRVYLPAALKGDESKGNFEDNELYVLFPFNMARENDGDAKLRQRILDTFWSCQPKGKGESGWHPTAIEAARLHLAEKATRGIIRHFRTGGWEYGGGHSPGGAPCRGWRGTSAPMFDGSCVPQTALQEALMQSHERTDPDDLVSGGVIRLLPAASAKWSGRFRLWARGGFRVDCTFREGRVVSAEFLSTRGGLLRYFHPETGELTSVPTRVGETVGMKVR